MLAGDMVSRNWMVNLYYSKHLNVKIEEEKKIAVAFACLLYYYKYKFVKFYFVTLHCVFHLCFASSLGNFVHAGNILATQRAMRYHPGAHVCHAVHGQHVGSIE